MRMWSNGNYHLLLVGTQNSTATWTHNLTIQSSAYTDTSEYLPKGLKTFLLVFSCSVVSHSLWPQWTAACQVSLSFTISWNSLKLMSTELMMPSKHNALCISLLILPSIFPSIRVFSNESTLRMMLPKYWSFSFSINPSKEYSGLISFRMDWFDLLAIQGALKSLFQHHSSKASVFWHSAFFMVQL